jgi:glycosyltransferase involved in cell wall biosynthesis
VPIEGDLPGLYRLASAFVTASPIETFGFVVLEAMASARPVVAVRAGSLPELVENSASGYLAPPGDEGALAEGLVRLLRNPEQAHRMGEQGRAAATHFGLSATLAGHERLYRSLHGLSVRAAPDGGSILART